MEGNSSSVAGVQAGLRPTEDQHSTGGEHLFRLGSEDHARYAALVDKARAENALLVVAEAWRPIATAPRTGEHILAARFNGDSGFGKGQPWMDVVCWWPYDAAGFYASSMGFNQNAPYDDLTHWMPLPPPPAENG
jgi:hypothetical protein